jgi:hypothetical protein
MIYIKITNYSLLNVLFKYSFVISRLAGGKKLFDGCPVALLHTLSFLSNCRLKVPITEYIILIILDRFNYLFIAPAENCFIIL